MSSLRVDIVIISTIIIIIIIVITATSSRSPGHPQHPRHHFLLLLLYAKFCWSGTLKNNEKSSWNAGVSLANKLALLKMIN